MIEPPMRFVGGRYRVGNLVARGEWTSIWSAEVDGVEGPLAIKFLDTQLASNPQASGRFFHTARVMAGLQGQNTARVLDVGSTESGVPFVVTARYDGESLESRLERARRLPLSDVSALVTDVAHALHSLHALGLVHRDVTPRDIFLARAGGREVALLLGFGLATSPADASRPGQPFVGTPYFVAPERLAMGQPVDARSDLWSLGVVAFIAATGAPPFDSRSMGELFALIAQAPLPVPSRVAPDLPPSFDAWFARACARDRNERFATAQELAEGLAAALLPPRSETTPVHSRACPWCGEAIEPRMIFCANCGRRLMDQGSRPAPAAAPAPTPAGAGRRATPDEPAAWLFRARLGVAPKELRAAGFSVSGTTALAVTASHVAVSRGQGWEEVHLTSPIDPMRVRAIRAIGPDAFFLLGTGGLVARVTLEGACEFWKLEPHAGAPVSAGEITFYDALTEGSGAILVGERLGANGTVGVMARASARSVRVVVVGMPAERLRSVVRMTGGRLLACGAGKLVALERDAVTATIDLTPGELYGVVPHDDGALIVGAGAYAFNVTRALKPTVEEVQTTADLVTLTAVEGIGWAGSNRGARILRRSSGGVWTRLTGNLGTEAGVLALAATEREVRAVLDDGTYVMGTLGT